MDGNKKLFSTIFPKLMRTMHIRVCVGKVVNPYKLLLYPLRLLFLNMTQSLRKIKTKNGILLF